MEVEKQLLKPVLGLYSGHDTNFTVYDPKTDKFHVFEFERMIRKKHYRGSDVQKGTGDFIPSKRDFNNKTYVYFLDYIKKHHGIENNFQFYTHRSRSDLKDYGQNIFKYDDSGENHCLHHDGHVWSAYMQSPFDDAFVLSWDGGGDGTCYQPTMIKAGEIVHSERLHYDFGSVYQFIFGKSDSFRNTDPIDIAGKIMGLSAYGKVYRFLFDEIDKIARLEDFPDDLYKLWEVIPENNYEQREYKIKCGRYNKKVVDNFYKFVKKKEKIFGIKIKEKDLAATVQSWIETRAIEMIGQRFYSKIKECGSNLIITGGCALNVLVNQKVKEMFQDINVYVPPNPHDGGISAGMVYKYLNENGYIPKGKKYDLSNSGPELFDKDRWEDHCISNNRYSTINLNGVVKLLRRGRILGFIQGNMEIGPRALGRRSILCDPCIPRMKDLINSKVKFREEYRPFAPVCRLEDASTYFSTRNFDNTESMSYTVIVKKEYRKKLSSITHEDNTARLQTVTKESDPVMYELLSHLDEPKVLLNTSFNVQGQPILNRLSCASQVLATTKLDGYVVQHDGKFYHFFK